MRERHENARTISQCGRFCGRNRTRTYNIILVRNALCQLSYAPYCKKILLEPLRFINADIFLNSPKNVLNDPDIMDGNYTNTMTEFSPLLPAAFRLHVTRGLLEVILPKLE